MALAMGNLLERALTIIPNVSFEYRWFDGNETNSTGNVIHRYSEWFTAHGIIEPGLYGAFGGRNISEKDYADMGLDWSRSYMTAWAKVDLHNIENGPSTDQIRFRGCVYNIIQCEDWIYYDGWKRFLCVKIIDDKEN